MSTTTDLQLTVENNMADVIHLFDEYMTAYEEIKAEGLSSWNENFKGRIPSLASCDEETERWGIYYLQGIKHLQDHKDRVQQALDSGYRLYSSLSEEETYKRPSSVILCSPPVTDEEYEKTICRRYSDWAEFEGGRVVVDNNNTPTHIMKKRARSRGYIVSSDHIVLVKF